MPAPLVLPCTALLVDEGSLTPLVCAHLVIGIDDDVVEELERQDGVQGDGGGDPGELNVRVIGWREEVLYLCGASVGPSQ